ncbi:MAG TPA: hypothetical protein VGT61_14180 [Thermomicrobiales bacterium]|jgi:hypothetical protein|nr:hypothetical protein [Thermomicrobiales bacterium]
MAITRDTLRVAARQFNTDHPTLWADVLAGSSQMASTITVYRQSERNYIPLVRYAIEDEDGEALTLDPPYPTTPTPDEQTAIDALVAGIGRA